MWADLAYRLRTLFKRNTVERELDEELQLHLEHETAKLVASGMPVDEAKRTAHIRLGGVEQIKEDTRDSHGVSTLDAVGRDLRYALRFLRKSPGFSLIAVGSLALGIGANAAIFQLLDAVRLRTLPVHNPHELAEIRIVDGRGSRGSFLRMDALTNPIWEQIRQRQRGFSTLFAWADTFLDISPGGEARPVRGVFVSGEFFDALQIRPAAGRLLTASEDRRGCGVPGAVISHSFWQSEYGGRYDAVGSKLTVEGSPVEIVGVTQEGFHGLEVGKGFDIILPICADDALHGKASRLDAGTIWWLSVMGRLTPGMNIADATASLQTISSSVFQSSLPSNYPAANVKDYLNFKLRAIPAGSGISRLRERYSDPLVLLLVLAALVLLIACANLANLLLARAGAREREIAIRLSIGASRARLIQQLMTESFVIAVAGAVAGLAAGRYLSALLVSLLSSGGNRIYINLTPDWRVLGFTGALAVLTCILFGLAPALHATRNGAGEALKPRGVTERARRVDLRGVLVAGQVAISCVLLFAALLFSGTFRNLIHVETGFRQDGVLIISAQFRKLNLPIQSQNAMQRDLLQRLRALPGIQSVSQTQIVPVSGSSSGNNVRLDKNRERAGVGSYRNIVGTEYFKTLGIPLIAGREFNERDAPETQRVAVVNETFAKQLGMTANPVGQRFWIEATPTSPETLFEVVGLSKDTKYSDLREEPQPVFYEAVMQSRRPINGTQIVVRSSLPAESVTAALRRTLVAFNPDIQFSFQVFRSAIRSSLLREQLMATLSLYFGVVACLLAAMGIYGVIAYLVARRRNEIGIRMALGANGGKIVRMVIGDTGWLLLSGLAVGTAISLAAARGAKAFLYGLTPNDPSTLAIALLLLAAIGFLAIYVPARRAARVDPVVALRQD